jgi:Subtilase family
MRRIVAGALLAIVLVFGANVPAWSQGAGPPVVTTGTRPIPPLGWYAMGSVFCAAAAPIVGTIVLGREMTANEVYRTTLGCLLGPPGWLLANQLFPIGVVTPGRPGGPRRPRSHLRQTRGGHISVPPPGGAGFVPDEVLVEIRSGASAQQIGRMTGQLQLTQLETQSFALTGRTLRRYRIGGGASVRATLLAMRRYAIAVAAQPNHIFLAQASPAPDGATQYAVGKLQLIEAHRVSNGDNVLVAVIDSQIDLHHPDLAGTIAEEDNVLGTPETPHAHGTAMAGAIAAHIALVGVAPKARLLAVRVFSDNGDSAQGTTFDILKGLDWAAAHHARIVNMSFAGPGDPMLGEMLSKAYARGMVLIAAVGNAGPNAPPLYPAADPHVIGVTATDADDQVLSVANRGAQVTVAAPGVSVLSDAPGDNYQLSTGTSIAAAETSGVAALLLAREPKLTPAEVRQALIRSARKVPGKRRDIGAGVIDALTAVNEFARVQ